MAATSKQCFKCKEMKPLTEFYVHPQMGEGRLNKCKDCTKRDVSANYRANIEHYRAYERRRLGNPDRVAARSEYACTARGKEAAFRGRMAWIQRNPLARAAHVAVGNAVRDGKLIRQPCEVCGQIQVHAHHDDYTKPLSVRWLCVDHHLEHHWRERENA